MGAQATEGAQIFGPFLGMMLLTFAVWIAMYVRRIHYMFAQGIAPQTMTTPERVAQLVPEPVANPANNLKNLFELPVLFYALCGYFYVTASVDTLIVASGWAFVGLRALHSVVQCSVNIVILRFALYVASSAVLWFMLLLAVVR